MKNKKTPTETIEEEFVDINENFEKQKKKVLQKKNEMSEKLDQALKANEEWKNEYAKVIADAQNFRKMLEKEQREGIKHRSKALIEKLIPVLDNFDFAFKVEPASKETQNYLFGFKMIQASLLGTLEEEGVKAIKPNPGEKFDPHTMEACDTRKDENQEDGVVLSLNLPGYMLHDALIRPASVVVNQLKNISDEE